MAKNDEAFIDQTVVEITANNVTAIRIQNQGVFPLKIMGTVGSNPPASWKGAMLIPAGQTMFADVTLAQVFPGVVGVNRVYAVAPNGTTLISISHA